MSAEARREWATKKCPYGVGNASGKCCTSECASWTEWDTRGTHVERIERWHNTKPGWFSEWSLKQVVGHERHQARSEPDSEGKRDYYWAPDTRRYLWVKEVKTPTGSVGGGCAQILALQRK